MKARFVIVQTNVPAFRLELFEELFKRTHSQFEVWSGEDYFTATSGVPATSFPWNRRLRNHFLLGRTMLWQHGHFTAAIGAKVCVLEFNPRILSNWLILLLRRIIGREVVLWGHVYPRAGVNSRTKFVRFLMLSLATSVNAYTYSEAEKLRRLFPHKRINVSPNAVMWARECQPGQAPDGGKHRLLFVARLIPEKKPVLLLAAFAQALPRLPENITLDFIGSGPCLEELEATIRAQKLEGRVKLHGSIYAAAKLQQFYAEAIVALSPGYVGLFATQAFGFGVPLLVADNELHSVELELCQRSFNCDFFPSDNVNRLADALVGFVRHPPAWSQNRDAICAGIRDRYSLDRMCDGFMSFFEPQVTQAASGDEPKVAIVWSNYGPYHYARFEAARRVMKSVVLAVEIGSVSSTHEWLASEDSRGKKITLFPEQRDDVPSALATYIRALAVFRQERVKVVLIPSYWPATSFAMLLAARAAGAKTVMMNESHAATAKAAGIFAIIKRHLVRKYDAALVGGTRHKEYFSALGLASEKIVFGYDAVDNNYFVRAADEARTQAVVLRARYGLPRRYFLNVGRMVWKKNLEILVDAYKQVHARLGADCPRLVLVGSGNLESALLQRCTQGGLTVLQLTSAAQMVRPSEADIIFMGFRQVQDLPVLYALASAFVLPSRAEEWGLVVNEAMACGLPVLVSRVAGCAPDLIKPGENGFLFDPFDASELAGYLEIIAREPALTDSMGAASRRIIADWGCERFAAGAQRAVEIAMGLNAEPEGRMARGTQDVTGNDHASSHAQLIAMNPNSPPRMHWVRHIAAVLLLAGLDINQRLRRRLNRAFLRVTMVLLSVMLAAVALSSLTALLQITESVKSLIGDDMVGVEATAVIPRNPGHL